MKQFAMLLLMMFVLCLIGLALRGIADSRILLIPKPAPVVEAVKLSEPYYFTMYNLVQGQTDSTPCIGASGKDLCKLNREGIKTIALTVDIRKKHGIKRGDQVWLTGDNGCAGRYQVHDEMGLRFRTKCIKRDGACIKGDIVNGIGGKCSIVL